MRRMGPVLLLLAAALAGPVVAARHRDPQQLPPTVVRDLQYGDVLFYDFQDDDFQALTRLSAYRHWNQLPHHDFDSQLLEAGLYFQLGMYNEAGRRFDQLLTPAVPQGVRDRAWFYLGKMWYTRGYLDRAEAAFRKVVHLPAQQEAERVHLLSNLLMDQQRFGEAIALLSRWTGPPDWMAYARLNLGIALARTGQLAQANATLTQLGKMRVPPGNAEMLALRDRANLALGFAQLQGRQPQLAPAPLQRVRLNGPYSNRALLGLGWADVALGDYRAAIVPWAELRRRDLLDSAVQESYLALPYAYSKLGADREAAAGYGQALQSFDAERGRIAAAIARVRSGELLAGLLRDDGGRDHGWSWQLRNLPDAPESRYLYAILADDDFQQGLQNYRDLLFLGSTLADWSQSTSAFADMIDARERAYAQRLPAANALLNSGRLAALRQRRDALAARLDAVESSHDVAALGTPTERGQWAQVMHIQAALAGAADTPDNRDLRERLRLLKGVLYYQLDDAFKARVWQQRRTLRDLDVTLYEAQGRWERLDGARHTAPADTAGFAARLAALRQRIGVLQARLTATEGRQDQYLRQLAAAALSAQASRLDAYEVQARFALASLYDRAASSAPAPGEPHPVPGAPAATPGNPAAAPGAPGTPHPAPGGQGAAPQQDAPR